MRYGDNEFPSATGRPLGPSWYNSLLVDIHHTRCVYRKLTSRRHAQRSGGTRNLQSCSYLFCACWLWTCHSKDQDLLTYNIKVLCITLRLHAWLQEKKAIYKTAGGIIASILKLVHTKTWRYTYVNHYSHTCTCICVDGVYSYQTSYGFASGQILRRSQGTLLPSSGEPKVSNPWNNVQCKDSI
jgi:hypothetical protein